MDLCVCYSVQEHPTENAGEDDGAMDMSRCPRCAKGNIISDVESGESICNRCGFVASDKMQEFAGSSYSQSAYIESAHSYAAEEGTNKTRTGSKMSLAVHDMGLSTVIDKNNKDFTGRQVPNSFRTLVDRLRNWDARSQIKTSQEKNLAYAFSELDKLKDKLQISDPVSERAAWIYRKTVERGIVRGRPIKAVMAAALYASCRDAETPRNLKDIAKTANIKLTLISRCYRMILSELDLRMPIADPKLCISRIASNVSLGEATKRKALNILAKAKEMQLTVGKEPMGIAAASIYLASLQGKEKKNQRTVAKAAGVTEVTIRNRSMELRNLLPKEILTSQTIRKKK